MAVSYGVMTAYQGFAAETGIRPVPTMQQWAGLMLNNSIFSYPEVREMVLAEVLGVDPFGSPLEQNHIGTPLIPTIPTKPTTTLPTPTTGPAGGLEGQCKVTQSGIAGFGGDVCFPYATQEMKDNPNFDPRDIPECPKGTPCGGTVKDECETKVCDCVKDVLERIDNMLDLINKLLSERITDVCKNIEKCTDKIIENIDKKFKGVAKTQAKCREELKSGLGGTLEWVLTCAHKMFDDCKTQCSQGDKETEGKCCDTCGSPDCICKDGSCVKKSEDKKEYRGWCHAEYGTIIVLPFNEEPPDQRYLPVSKGTDIAAVEQAAQAACKKDETPKPVDPISWPKFPTFQSQYCGLSNYTDGSALAKMFPADSTLDVMSAFIQAVHSLQGTTLQQVRDLDAGPALATTLFNMATMPSNMVLLAGPSIATALGCSNPNWLRAYNTLCGFSYVEKMIGVDLTQFKMPFTYAMNATCPQMNLSPDQAIAAYLGNSINLTQLAQHWQIAGYCPDALKWTLPAAKAKPMPMELMLMRRREIIGTTEYNQGMRRLGYIDQDVIDDIYKITEQVPTLSDIVRFMVRDADDDDIAERFGLDSEFDKKYGKQLKKWSKDQGIPDDVAKYAWRSHWTIPSPGQLFTFYHRLRYNKKYGGPEKMLTDVKSALIQQDILPFWHDYYLDTSFSPLTRVDARRGFDIGALSEAQLRDSYLDQGYSDDNADILVDFTKRLRKIGALSNRHIKKWIAGLQNRETTSNQMVSDGLPTILVSEVLNEAENKFVASPMASAFVRGDTSRDDFILALTNLGVRADSAARVATSLGYKITNTIALQALEAGRLDVDAAISTSIAEGMAPEVAAKRAVEIDNKLDNNAAKACQRGVRRRFLLGELDNEQVQGELSGTGTTLKHANRLLSAWQCERKALGKAIPASTLCKWLERGAITPIDFIKRLTNIGYSAESASLMVDDCLISISVKRQKQAEKEFKEQTAEERRAARELEKLQAKAARDEANLIAAQEKARLAKERREKQAASAAEKWIDKTDDTVYGATQAVKQWRQTLQSSYAQSIDGALQVLIVAIEGFNGGTPDELDIHIQEIADGVLSSGELPVTAPA